MQILYNIYERARITKRSEITPFDLNGVIV
jgi:hypothetical protein